MCHDTHRSLTHSRCRDASKVSQFNSLIKLDVIPSKGDENTEF